MLPLPEPEKLTPSGMNEFYYCPKMWELHKRGIGGIFVERDIVDLGSCIHNSIAEFLRVIGDKPSPENIKKIFTAIFDANFEKYSLGHLNRRAEKLKKNFIEFEIERAETWKVYRPTLVEGMLETEKFRTKVDFYSEPMRTLIDWKSGNKQGISNNDLRQGKVMEIVLKEHGYHPERLLFVALYPNRTFELPRVLDGFVVGEEEEMRQFIRTNHYPKRGKWCEDCDVVLDCQLDSLCLWM